MHGHVVQKQLFNHPLVHQQYIRLQHIDDRREMAFPPFAVQWLVRVRVPERDIVDLDTLLENGLHNPHLLERLERLGLQTVCAAGGRLVIAFVQDLGGDAVTS